jgi:hypothetical protein
MLDPARDIDDNAAIKLDLLFVENHLSLTVNNVIELVRPLVIVQLGVINFDVMDFRGRFVSGFD